MQIHQVLLPILNLSDKNVGSKFNQIGTSKFRDQAKTNHEAYIIEYIQIPARKAVLLFRVWALAFPFGKEETSWDVDGLDFQEISEISS